MYLGLFRVHCCRCDTNAICNTPSPWKYHNFCNGVVVKSVRLRRGHVLNTGSFGELFLSSLLSPLTLSESSLNIRKSLLTCGRSSIARGEFSLNLGKSWILNFVDSLGILIGTW